MKSSSGYSKFSAGIFLDQSRDFCRQHGREIKKFEIFAVEQVDDPRDDNKKVLLEVKKILKSGSNVLTAS